MHSFIMIASKHFPGRFAPCFVCWYKIIDSKHEALSFLIVEIGFIVDFEFSRYIYW
jgi:hypothetical protein